MLSLPGEVIVATAVTSAELLEDKRKEIDSDNVTLLSMPNEEGKVDLRALLQFWRMKGNAAMYYWSRVRN